MSSVKGKSTAPVKVEVGPRHLRNSCQADPILQEKVVPKKPRPPRDLHALAAIRRNRQKGGPHKNKKKEADRSACREKVSEEQ